MDTDPDNFSEQFAKMPSRVAARVPRGTVEGTFDLDKWASDNKRAQGVDFIGFALAAAAEALENARLPSLAWDEGRRESWRERTVRRRTAHPRAHLTDPPAGRLSWQRHRLHPGHRRRR